MEALPQPRKKSCWEILGIPEGSSQDKINARYREMAQVKHPDKGGSNEEFNELKQARDEALKQISQ